MVSKKQWRFFYFLFSIKMVDTDIQERNSFYLLGLTFYTDLKWRDYIESLAKKLGSRCRARQLFMLS